VRCVKHCKRRERRTEKKGIEIDTLAGLAHPYAHRREERHACVLL